MFRWSEVTVEPGREIVEFSGCGLEVVRAFSGCGLEVVRAFSGCG